MPATRGKRGILPNEEPKEKRLITHHFRTMRSTSAAAGKALGNAHHKSAAGPKTPAAKDRPTSAKTKAAASAGVPTALEARASARLAKTTAALAKPDCKAAAAKPAPPGTKDYGMLAQAESPAKKPRLAPQKVSCCCSCSTAQLLPHAAHHPRPVWCAVQVEAASALGTVTAGSSPWPPCSFASAGWALVTALLTDPCDPDTP